MEMSPLLLLCYSAAILSATTPRSTVTSSLRSLSQHSLCRKQISSETVYTLSTRRRTTVSRNALSPTDSPLSIQLHRRSTGDSLQAAPIGPAHQYRQRSSKITLQSKQSADPTPRAGKSQRQTPPPSSWYLIHHTWRTSSVPQRKLCPRLTP